MANFLFLPTFILVEDTEIPILFLFIGEPKPPQSMTFQNRPINSQYTILYEKSVDKPSVDRSVLKILLFLVNCTLLVFIKGTPFSST